MKNLLKISTLAICLLMSINSFAQLEIGARGGINLATIDNDFNYSQVNYDKAFLPGMDFALYAKIPVGPLAVQPEIHYVQKGIKYNFDNADGTSGEMKMKSNYLELPVLARIDIGEYDFKFNVFAGPSVGYALTAKVIGENVSFTESPGVDWEEDVKWDDDFATDGIKDNRFDVGIVGGVGVSYLLDNLVNIVLDTRYTMDLNKQVIYEDSNVTEVDHAYSRGLSITVGVAYPFRF